MLQKGEHEVCFDICIPTPKGMIFAMYFKREVEVAAAATEKPLKMTMQQAHDRLGHCNKDLTRSMAKQLNWEVTGTLKSCDACAAGKAKQKNVPKETGKDEKDDDIVRIFLDIASVKQMKGQPAVAKPHWRIMVDEKTQLKFSDFFAKKNEMVEKTCEQFKMWSQNNLAIKAVRLDNAGENKLLKSRCESKDWQLGIKFEFTARDTPQQNSLAERALATIANRGRAMMYSANVPMNIRYKVWTEAFKTATLLDGLVPIELDGKIATRYEHWCGKIPEFAKHLRVWGEAGTVKIKTKTTPKLADRGVQCMMVGYALDHPGDCYRMWDPKTARVHETRDVVWLKRMFYEKAIAEKHVGIGPIYFTMEEGDDVNEEVGEGNINAAAEIDDDNGSSAFSASESEDMEEEEQIEVEVTRSGRAVKPPTRFIEEIGAAAKQYKIQLTAAEMNYYAAMREFPEGEYSPGEIACVGAGLGGGFVNTKELHVMKYKDAMASKDAEKWKIAVSEEHQRMEDHGVFQPVPKEEIPDGAKVLTSTWAMKKKSNGTFRARLNARGYEQVDGEHYDEDAKAAPVVNEATIHIVLIIILMTGLSAELLDVKGAFLHGEFEKDRKVYMQVPEGMETYYPQDCVLLLLKTLYGTKQAAKAFWIKLLEAFRSMGYQRSKADPCMYFSWTMFGLIIWLSWVDDCLVCGRPEGIKYAKQQLMDRFDCDEVGELKEYVGCKIEHDKEGGWMKLTQPVLMQSYIDEFNLPDGDVPKTPATPGEVLQRGETRDCVDSEKQSKYRSGVGKLLHMMKWTRPEILNSVRELSRFMSGATLAHMKAMYRVMKYCVGTPNRGLLLKPTMKWNGDPEFRFIVCGRADSDYAKDPEKRRSVSGYATFVCGAPVTMKSRMQGCVTLSVTEAELVSGTQCAQDMLFNMRVLESIGLKVEKPMILEMDNKGAVDLCHNWSIAGKTRHDSIRQNFLRELEEQQIITVKWISTDDNSADLFTKNLPGPTFERHTAIYCGCDEYMDNVVCDSQGEGVRDHTGD
jgi:hypothetical protein